MLIEDELLSLSKEQRRDTVIIVEGKLGEAGEVGVSLKMEGFRIGSLEDSLGGTQIITQVQSSKFIRP